MDHVTSARGDYSAESRAGFAEWVAFGAVVVGTVGAVVGAARCAASGARHAHFQGRHSDSTTVTAPHGDKLSPMLTE